MTIGNECEVLSVQATISVDSSSETVSQKVEKVSQNVDMDYMPLCFGDFKKCTINFNFKRLELVSLKFEMSFLIIVY